jgi:uncharacterized membrane protein YqiK
VRDLHAADGKKGRIRKRNPDGRIIALTGEAGYQADTVPPGLHVGLWPWQYPVDRVEFFTVPPGKVGCVEACDGQPLQVAIAG